MKNRILYVVIAAFMASVLCGCGQNLMSIEQESKAVWDVRLAVEDALRREDTGALMKLWTEDAAFYVPNVGMFTGKGQIRKTHKELFDRYDDIEFKFKRLAIKFPTPDVAIEDVSYVFTATDHKSNGRDVTVLVKRNGCWLITAVLDLIPMAPTESVTEEAADNSKKEIEAIHRRENEFLAAHAFNDGAKLAEFYTDDALLIPPDEPIVSGKQAISEWYQNEFKKAPPIENPKVNLEDIEIRGDLAFLRGNFILKFKGQTEDQPIIQNLRFISIWRKTLDGSWKFYRDLWNINAPPSPIPKDLTTTPAHQFELIPTEDPKQTSEEVYQVGWIKASLPGDESRVQMIPVQMDEPDINWPQWGLNRQDINFDGYLDIGVYQHGGAKWGRFHWYLYDPDKMKFYTNALTQELSELTCASLKADPKTKRINRTQFIGAEIKEYTYQIVDGHLRLSQSRLLGE